MRLNIFYLFLILSIASGSIVCSAQDRTRRTERSSLPKQSDRSERSSLPRPEPASVAKTKNWKDIEITTDTINLDPTKYRLVKMDFKQISANIRSSESSGQVAIVELPLPNGESTKFTVNKSSIMSDELRKRHPEILSYVGKGVGKSMRVMLDINSSGLKAEIDHYYDTYMITPVRPGSDYYMVYNSKDLDPSKASRPKSY